MSELITAWRHDTGERVLVPEHWFDTDLGDPFTRTDPAAAQPAEAPPSAPTVSVATALETRPSHKPSRKES